MQKAWTATWNSTGLSLCLLTKWHGCLGKYYSQRLTAIDFTSNTPLFGNLTLTIFDLNMLQASQLGHWAWGLWTREGYMRRRTIVRKITESSVKNLQFESPVQSNGLTLAFFASVKAIIICKFGVTTCNFHDNSKNGTILSCDSRSPWNKRHKCNSTTGKELFDRFGTHYFQSEKLNYH